MKLNRKKKRKVKKFNALGLSVVFFVIAVLSWLGCSLYVNNRIVGLSMEIQEMTDEIAILKKENMQLDNDISYLKSPERVFEIAATSGLTRPD